MQEVIHDLFTEEELKIYDEERLILSLKKVIGDLEDRKINFYSLGNDQFYREILPRYFKWQGYGYLGNASLHILKDYMLKDRDLADTSLAHLLLDTEIIGGIPVTEKNPLETENIIKYRRSKGLKEKIIISYDVLDRFPFYIKEVQCGHKNIISIEVDNEGSRKKVILDIDIPANDHVSYNFTESLIIYTDFEVKVIDFSVICDTKALENAKSIDDFQGFLKLIKINRKSAKNIFNNEDGFKAFLEQNGDIEQILNYEDCKKIGTEIDNYSFALFCDINEINKEKLFKTAFSNNSILNEKSFEEKKDTKIDKGEIKKTDVKEDNVTSLKNNDGILENQDVKKYRENISKKNILGENIKGYDDNTQSKNINNKEKTLLESNAYKEIEEAIDTTKSVKKDINLDKKIMESLKNYEFNLEKYEVNKEKIENKVEDKIIPESENSYTKDKRGFVLKEEKEKIEKDLKQKNNPVSLEYIGKVEETKKNGIKYSTELLAKARNNNLEKYDTLEKNNVLEYNEIKNKRANLKEENLFKDNIKEDKTSKKKELDKNELSYKIKKLDNKQLDEFSVQELQRDNKYRITKKDSKEANRKDMNIVDKIKGMFKGFKRD